MFTVWGGSLTRPTRDIDLLGKTDNNPDNITSIMKDVCQTGVEADGLLFNHESISTNRIMEDAGYEGLRVHLQGSFGKAPVKLQIDIGFGDVIVPEKVKVKYPALLDYPAPELNGYTMESTIAEKFHAMLAFGLTNSRMKDFYDIWNLSRNFDFSGEVLSRAVKETLKKRQYELEKTSVEFLDTFAGDEQKNSQWKSFLEKTKLDDAPDSFANVVHAIRLFIQPIADSLAGDVKFRSIWTAPGPWGS